jgi:hypothetical protein
MFRRTPRSRSSDGTGMGRARVGSPRRSSRPSLGSRRARDRSRCSRRASWDPWTPWFRASHRLPGIAPASSFSALRNVSYFAKERMAPMRIPPNLTGPAAGRPRSIADGVRPPPTLGPRPQVPSSRVPAPNGWAGAGRSNSGDRGTDRPPTVGTARRPIVRPTRRSRADHSTRSHRDEMVYPRVSITPAKIAR